MNVLYSTVLVNISSRACIFHGIGALLVSQPLFFLHFEFFSEFFSWTASKGRNLETGISKEDIIFCFAAGREGGRGGGRGEGKRTE